MMKKQLTTKFIREVQPQDKPKKYPDLHGLALRVMPTGSKQFIWRGTVNGVRRDVGFGAPPYTTLEEVRDRAFEYRKATRVGDDPLVGKRSSVPTFAQAVEQVIEAHSAAWKNEANGNQLAREYA